ncbi:MAG: hypothetical protein RIC95_05915 [Vicingaceae bacterium]
MKSPLTVALLLSLAFAACQPQQAKEAKQEKETQTEQVKKEVQTAPANWAAIDTDEALVATALMAAPKESRDSCQVIGYNMAGEFVTFREGTNEFVVLTDNPQKKGFNAACYHQSLEPFMARGRELKAEGKQRAEIFKIRGEEIESGKLKMGNAGATLHLYYGPNESYNPETSEVEGANYRYVVYLPFATPESTGLPIQPVASNHPWIMDPGTHRAHIMITPLQKD